MDDDRLADKVAREPVVFMDCTTTEILYVGGGSLIGCFIFGILLGVIIGAVMVGIIIGLILGLGVAWLLLTQIQRLRNAYYENWLNEKIFLAKQEWGLGEITMLFGSKRFGRGSRKNGR